MRWLDERLALGDASDALGIGRLEEAGITGVLSLDWFPLSSPSPQLDWRKHPLIDGPGNASTALEAALADLRRLLDAHERVLVHCREGVSRTPFIVACHLASTGSRSLAEAIDEVRERTGWISINQGLIESWSILEAARSGTGGSSTSE
jgi:protein-tyrosine phosphatase